MIGHNRSATLFETGRHNGDEMGLGHHADSGHSRSIHAAALDYSYSPQANGADQDYQVDSHAPSTPTLEVLDAGTEAQENYQAGEATAFQDGRTAPYTTTTFGAFAGGNSSFRVYGNAIYAYGSSPSVFAYDGNQFVEITPRKAGDGVYARIGGTTGNGKDGDVIYYGEYTPGPNGLVETS